eukprot:1186764-Rhodomonas_salina.1
MQRGKRGGEPGRERGAHCTGMRLRVRYAMSGTDLAYAAIRLRACYAMSSTGIAYSATSLRASYAMSGTY